MNRPSITLTHLKRHPTLRRRFDQEFVRIWSGEHEAWWRPGGHGYTTNPLDAGVYPFPEAVDMTHHCGPEKKIGFTTTNQFERVCVHCGCRDSRACPGGCTWVEIHEATPTGVCSQCATKLQNATPQTADPVGKTQRVCKNPKIGDDLFAEELGGNIHIATKMTRDVVAQAIAEGTMVTYRS